MQIAFLTAMVGPKVGEAAAQAALQALTQQALTDPDTKGAAPQPGRLLSPIP